jgi:hypothetical protein
MNTIDIGMIRFLRHRVPGSVLALGLVLLAPTTGCSSDDDKTDSSGGAPQAAGSGGRAGGQSGSGGAAAGGGAPSGKQGTFSVDMHEATRTNPARTNVLGIIYDGPVPSGEVPLKLESTSGDCELLVPWAPFCSEPCPGGSKCTADDTCTAQPQMLDVGPVVLSGLGDELTMEAIAGNYQSPTLPAEPCEEGVAVSVQASSFSMEAKCIARLELTTPVPIPVIAGKAVDLAWTPASNGVGSRVKIHLDIAHHGGKKGEINCDVPDTGSFAIPEKLVTQLVKLGLAGYPDIALERYTRDADAANPNVALKIGSLIRREVDTGVISCDDDSQCPSGKTCNTANRTCA